MPGREQDTADYIAEQCAELVAAAKAQGLDTLAHLLDMARLEAEQHREPEAPPGPR